jgi:hypothetical protein
VHELHTGLEKVGCLPLLLLLTMFFGAMWAT